METKTGETSPDIGKRKSVSQRKSLSGDNAQKCLGKHSRKSLKTKDTNVKGGPSVFRNIRDTAFNFSTALLQNTGAGVSKLRCIIITDTPHTSQQCKTPKDEGSKCLNSLQNTEDQVMSEHLIDPQENTSFISFSRTFDSEIDSIVMSSHKRTSLENISDNLDSCHNTYQVESDQNVDSQENTYVNSFHDLDSQLDSNVMSAQNSIIQEQASENRTVSGDSCTSDNVCVQIDFQQSTQLTDRIIESQEGNSHHDINFQETVIDSSSKTLSMQQSNKSVEDEIETTTACNKGYDSHQNFTEKFKIGRSKSAVYNKHSSVKGKFIAKMIKKFEPKLSSTSMNDVHHKSHIDTDTSKPVAKVNRFLQGLTVTVTRKSKQKKKERKQSKQINLKVNLNDKSVEQLCSTNIKSKSSYENSQLQLDSSEGKCCIKCENIAHDPILTIPTKKENKQLHLNDQSIDQVSSDVIKSKNSTSQLDTSKKDTFSEGQCKSITHEPLLTIPKKTESKQLNLMVNLKDKQLCSTDIKSSHTNHTHSQLQQDSCLKKDTFSEGQCRLQCKSITHEPFLTISKTKESKQLNLMMNLKDKSVEQLCSTGIKSTKSHTNSQLQLDSCSEKDTLSERQSCFKCESITHDPFLTISKINIGKITKQPLWSTDVTKDLKVLPNHKQNTDISQITRRIECGVQTNSNWVRESSTQSQITNFNTSGLQTCCKQVNNSVENAQKARSTRSTRSTLIVVEPFEQNKYVQTEKPSMHTKETSPPSDVSLKCLQTQCKPVKNSTKRTNDTPPCVDVPVCETQANHYHPCVQTSECNKTFPKQADAILWQKHYFKTNTTISSKKSSLLDCGDELTTTTYNLPDLNSCPKIRNPSKPGNIPLGERSSNKRKKDTVSLRRGDWPSAIGARINSKLQNNTNTDANSPAVCSNTDRKQSKNASNNEHQNPCSVPPSVLQLKSRFEALKERNNNRLHKKNQPSTKIWLSPIDVEDCTCASSSESTSECTEFTPGHEQDSSEVNSSSKEQRKYSRIMYLADRHTNKSCNKTSDSDIAMPTFPDVEERIDLKDSGENYQLEELLQKQYIPVTDKSKKSSQKQQIPATDESKSVEVRTDKSPVVEPRKRNKSLRRIARECPSNHCMTKQSDGTCQLQKCKKKEKRVYLEKRSYPEKRSEKSAELEKPAYLKKLSDLEKCFCPEYPTYTNTFTSPIATILKYVGSPLVSRKTPCSEYTTRLPTLCRSADDTTHETSNISGNETSQTKETVTIGDYSTVSKYSSPSWYDGSTQQTNTKCSEIDDMLSNIISESESETCSCTTNGRLAYSELPPILQNMCLIDDIESDTSQCSKYSNISKIDSQCSNIAKKGQFKTWISNLINFKSKVIQFEKKLDKKARRFLKCKLETEEAKLKKLKKERECNTEHELKCFKRKSVLRDVLHTQSNADIKYPRGSMSSVCTKSISPQLSVKSTNRSQTPSIKQAMRSPQESVNCDIPQRDSAQNILYSRRDRLKRLLNKHHATDTSTTRDEVSSYDGKGSNRSYCSNINCATSLGQSLQQEKMLPIIKEKKDKNKYIVQGTKHVQQRRRSSKISSDHNISHETPLTISNNRSKNSDSLRDRLFRRRHINSDRLKTETSVQQENMFPWRSIDSDESQSTSSLEQERMSSRRKDNNIPQRKNTMQKERIFLSSNENTPLLQKRLSRMSKSHHKYAHEETMSSNSLRDNKTRQVKMYLQPERISANRIVDRDIIQRKTPAQQELIYYPMRSIDDDAFQRISSFDHERKSPRKSRDRDTFQRQRSIQQENIFPSCSTGCDISQRKILFQQEITPSWRSKNTQTYVHQEITPLKLSKSSDLYERKTSSRQKGISPRRIKDSSLSQLKSPLLQEKIYHSRSRDSERSQRKTGLQQKRLLPLRTRDCDITLRKKSNQQERMSPKRSIDGELFQRTASLERSRSRDISQRKRFMQSESRDSDRKTLLQQKRKLPKKSGNRRKIHAKKNSTF